MVMGDSAGREQVPPFRLEPFGAKLEHEGPAGAECARGKVPLWKR